MPHVCDARELCACIVDLGKLLWDFSAHHAIDALERRCMHWGSVRKTAFNKARSYSITHCCYQCTNSFDPSYGRQRQ